MDNITWEETTQEVYRAIYSEHHEDFGVFGTCTLPYGDMRLGKPNPYILTEWGFKGATDPIIKSIGTKEHRDQKDYDYKYYIAVANVQNED